MGPAHHLDKELCCGSQDNSGQRDIWEYGNFEALERQIREYSDSPQMEPSPEESEWWAGVVVKQHVRVSTDSIFVAPGSVMGVVQWRIEATLG